VGIAYLGAVSYQADRGIVAAQVDEYFRIANDVSVQVEGVLGAALDELSAESERLKDATVELDALHRVSELEARPFLISASGQLHYPPLDAFRPTGDIQSEPFVDALTRRCPQRNFDQCVRQAASRIRALERARSSEVGACSAETGRCIASAKSRAEARRIYLGLVAADETGPEALLGLARLARAGDDVKRARKHYQQLISRYGDRVNADGVSYALLAALGSAATTGDTSQLLDIYRRLIEREYVAPASALAVIADQVRAALGDAPNDAASRAAIDDLDARLKVARARADLAAILDLDVAALSRMAGPGDMGRPATGNSDWTLVYRRLTDGDVIGLIVDNTVLDGIAERAGIATGLLAEGTRAMVRGINEERSAQATSLTLASASFGQFMPHINVLLMRTAGTADPLDAIVRRRGRRHIALTGGLVALLVIGLIATIRGAARERELARLKSEFVSTVSHELKTPLTSIRMFGEMLQQGVAGSDRDREARYHGIIVKESERLGLLIANLLDYSQIERGTRRYVQDRELAGEVVGEAVTTFQRLREGENQQVLLEVEEAAGDTPLFIDREVVVQSLLNLLSNAAKYGDGKEPIEVRLASRAGDHVAMSVRDRGPGIPATEQLKIFREFYRAPSAYKSQVEGTGLGLALVKQHVEAQGGEVELDSSEGKGATFSIVFPRLAA
jgi:signal transduction histidine kinase